MHTYASDFVQPVFFVIRVTEARTFWAELLTLLHISRGYKLLLWFPEDNIVSIDDLIYIHDHSEIHRVYYDLPEVTRNRFLSRLADRLS